MCETLEQYQGEITSVAIFNLILLCQGSVRDQLTKISQIHSCYRIPKLKPWIQEIGEEQQHMEEQNIFLAFIPECAT